MNKAGRNEFTRKRVKIPSFNLLSCRYEEERNLVPLVREKMDLFLPSVVASSGNRLLMNPNVFTHFSNLPVRTMSRRSPLNIKRAYQEIDTIKFILPPSYKVEGIPGRQEIRSRFGEYSSEIKEEDGTITYIRTLKFFKGLFQPDEYNSFVDFCESISFADDSRLSFVWM